MSKLVKVNYANGEGCCYVNTSHIVALIPSDNMIVMGIENNVPHGFVVDEKSFDRVIEAWEERIYI